jgi:hypothetical protein
MKALRLSGTRLLFLAVGAAALLAVGIVSGCGTESHAKATCKFSAESAYVDIRLTNSHLTAIYLPTTFKPQGPPLEQGGPEYTPKDLRHAEARVTNREMNQFVQLVKSSGFLKLKKVSGAAHAGRYYATTISVELNGRTNAVVYLSSPDAPPMPKAFADVRAWLLKTTAAKMKDFPGPH